LAQTPAESRSKGSIVLDLEPGPKKVFPIGGRRKSLSKRKTLPKAI